MNKHLATPGVTQGGGFNLQNSKKLNVYGTNLRGDTDEGVGLY